MRTFPLALSSRHVCPYFHTMDDYHHVTRILHTLLLSLCFPLRLHVDQTVHVVPHVVTEPVPAVLVTLTHLAPVDHLLAGHDPLHGPVVRLVLSQAGSLVSLVVIGRDTAA